MPIRRNLPHRLVTLGSGSSAMDVWFYYDPTLAEWLSVHTMNYVFARNAVGVTGFIRTTNGVLTSNTHGPLVFYKTKIVGVAASATNNPSGAKIQIHSNGAQVGSNIAWSGGTQTKSVDRDIDEVKTIGVALGTPAITSPDYPVIDLTTRWRL